MVEIITSFPMTRWEEMLSFLSECYRPDHAMCHKEFFEWQFLSKYNQGNAKMLCALEDGKLQCILGYIPLQVHWGDLNKPIAAAWTLAWMTRKNSVKGLGFLLQKKIKELHPFSLTVNASAMGQPILQAMGWISYSPVPRYISILDAEKCLKMVFHGVGRRDIGQFCINEKINGSSRLVETLPNKDIYNPEWSRYTGLRFGTVRSLKYIQWRYIEHPMFKYHFVTKGAPERPAVCVYRIENAFGDYEAKVARIVDFFFPNDQEGMDDGTSLLSSVLKRIKADGCAYADFICSSRFYSRPFIEFGAAEEPTDRQMFPMRLMPIERVVRHQNVAFITPLGYTLPALDEMYITKSDIDGDGPANKPKLQ